ncbi:TlpA family protein disulfide reductase [Corynebacterium singulare]|uniref:TlpA family protein disulfide reductase n=1 Tax=Corynebacterium singulare TaxID=161899 RepID=UPI0011A0E88D|nr:TlpA disulfide reductase family protein [Corynebacterium singulare]
MSQYSRWPGYVKASIAAVLMLAALALVGVVNLLEDDEPEVAVPQSQEQEVAKRPKCPEGPIAGVDLPCLGAASTAAAKDIQIVTVWAWWCEPCRTELPFFQDIARSHSTWNVVGVHADANAANGAALLDDLGVDLPSYQDENGTFAGELGLPNVIPVTVVVRDGKVEKKFVKPFTSADELEQAIDEVLK